MTDREAILAQLEASVAALEPGFHYWTPDGQTHAPIQTDLGRRVYIRMRPQDAIDSVQCPSIEIIPDERSPELLGVYDRDTYGGELMVTLWGYDRADDQADSADSVLRPRLNALRADLWIAIHACPFFPYPSADDALVRRFGILSVRVLTQWTEPAHDSTAGFVVMTAAIRYAINRHLAR